MPSTATGVYQQIDQDVEALLGLHTGSGEPGRPVGNNGPLLRSAIVLLVTAWENYVEQAVTEVFDHAEPAIRNDHTLLSAHLRSAVAKKAKDDPWAVVHDGWLTVARTRAAYEIRSFNNAASRQTNELVHHVLGCEDVLNSVGWQAVSSTKAQTELTELVNDIRGEIVHRGTTPGSLNLPGVRSWRRFLSNLVKSFDKAIADAAEGRYGSRPW
ncbi:HEPN domain-containing protein [Actinotalea subterranea]|uniref:HEPN domain-containing protein n=1 Tax=Actinotalea subterranea TaxID=2607497 RepID=UPI0011F0916C|nr:HEPN domain-containing protein [Actinotalea subterranea]